MCFLQTLRLTYTHDEVNKERYRARWVTSYLCFRHNRRKSVSNQGHVLQGLN